MREIDLESVVALGWFSFSRVDHFLAGFGENFGVADDDLGYAVCAAAEFDSDGSVFVEVSAVESELFF